MSVTGELHQPAVVGWEETVVLGVMINVTVVRFLDDLYPWINLDIITVLGVLSMTGLGWMD